MAFVKKLASDYEVVTSYYIPLLFWQISWNSSKTLPEKHKPFRVSCKLTILNKISY